ncbi:MAG: DUF1576 domain-containing protein [Oscillospiraceae bacterium]|nr:DUF1576 domain-containing protein [Oscillospiraceae bacterium]
MVATEGLNRPGSFRRLTNRMDGPYWVILGLFATLVLAAFILDTPQNIWAGLLRIFTSRSILISDYAALGGMGAMLVSSVLVGLFSLTIMIIGGVKPTGGIIMGVWLILGFAFFGKNLLNSAPLTLGVWLFAKTKGMPFRDVAVTAMMCTSVAPIVSELAYLTPFAQPAGAFVGLFAGAFVGYIFAPLAIAMGKVHGGYLLYNAGFVGGLIATFVTSILRSGDVTVTPMLLWSTGYNLPLGVLMYVLAAGLIILGFATTGKDRWQKFKKLTKHSGRLTTDYYAMYGEVIYLNMGILLALGTSAILLLGGHINGATMGGIFCIVGFAALGKNLRNVIPIMIGIILGAFFDVQGATAPSNQLAILFGTGIAPLAGQFGPIWGIISGFVHVNLVGFVGLLNGGLNLYNNGFAGGFVVIFMIPIITALSRREAE